MPIITSHIVFYKEILFQLDIINLDILDMHFKNLKVLFSRYH